MVGGIALSWALGLTADIPSEFWLVIYSTGIPLYFEVL